MTWRDRLGPAVYVSPSGVRLEFIYDDLSKSFDKHTSEFTFPEVDGSFIQDLGRSGRRFPFQAIFSGPDYDLTADTFDAMLEESGVGVLTHPIYGTFSVVPFGTISRRDRVKSAGNQAVFNVTFFETTGVLFPFQESAPALETQKAIDEFLEVSPVAFSESLDLSTTVEGVTWIDRYEAVLDQVEESLRPIVAITDRLRQEFDTVSQAIRSTIALTDTVIATLITAPLTLAFQIGQLMKLPAITLALISDRLDAYGDLLKSLTVDGEIYSPDVDSQPNNNFHNDDLFSSNVVIAMATSVLNNQFETKTEAISAAEILLDACATWITWRDLNLDALGIIDTGETYQQVERACSVAAGFLVQISFSLKQERSITLVRPRTLIDLEAFLYGTVDENLDFLITTNDMVGEEILEVPAGRTVVYYV